MTLRCSSSDFAILVDSLPNCDKYFCFSLDFRTFSMETVQILSLSLCLLIVLRPILDFWIQFLYELTSHETFHFIIIDFFGFHKGCLGFLNHVYRKSTKLSNWDNMDLSIGYIRRLCVFFDWIIGYFQYGTITVCSVMFDKSFRISLNFMKEQVRQDTQTFDNGQHEYGGVVVREDEELQYDKSTGIASCATIMRQKVPMKRQAPPVLWTKYNDDDLRPEDQRIQEDEDRLSKMAMLSNLNLINYTFVSYVIHEQIRFESTI